MSAASFSQRPHQESPAIKPEVPGIGHPLARCTHRGVATVFTLTVAANFVAMAWGQPPAWITYAPLPPLLFLLATGLVMLVAPWIGSRRAGQAVARRVAR